MSTNGTDRKLCHSMNTIRNKHVPCSSRGVKRERELRISLAITHGVLVLEKVEGHLFFHRDELHFIATRSPDDPILSLDF